MCVTAFPVLARIVKEKQLFRTRLGVTVLSTAAWADVAAWTLLALSVSLISGGSKFNILWTFLCLIGIAIVGLGPGRWILRKLIVRKGKPIDISPTVFAILIVGTLSCSWLTAYVGIHSIFGAFLFGIILPRDGGFCVKLAEKYEDFVTAFFLPLYFTASGLRTQLGLLNDGNTWGLLLLLISVAIITKVGSGLVAARFTGLSWRESFTLGVLMNTKGLVELIVLNIGLDNKLISPTTFSMMVVLALVTTFLTSPVVHFTYPYYRIIEFENQTPGKTVLVAAVRDRVSVAPMLGVLSLIASGRPKKYRMRVMHTMPLPDRPSAYMTKAHVDDVLDHVKDLAHILTLKIKTLALTNDDSDSQKVEQLVAISQAQSTDFYFTYWKLGDGERLDPNVTIGGHIARKMFTSPSFRGHLAVLLDRGLHSTVKHATFIYTGSEHDHQAAKLVKAMLHTRGAHVTVIYGMNPASHPAAISSPDQIKDAILASLFIKERLATIDLIALYDANLTTAIANALNSLDEPGIVICGTNIHLDPSKDGVNYRDIITESTRSFLCVIKGSKGKDKDTESPTDSDLNGLISPPTEPNADPFSSPSTSTDDSEYTPPKSRKENGQSKTRVEVVEMETLHSPSTTSSEPPV